MELQWQDIGLMVGGFLFSIALIPTLRAKEKPAPKTSLLTASVLSLFAVIYLSLGLLLACLSTLATATCWWVLLAQASKNQREEIK